MSSAVITDTVVTIIPTDKSKLPTTTTKVNPIEIMQLTIIENRMLLMFEKVRNHSDASENDIAVRMMTMIVPHRRNSPTHHDSLGPATTGVGFGMLAVCATTCSELTMSIFVLFDFSRSVCQ